jgi:hypothetical protein
MTSAVNPDFITTAPVSKTGMRNQLGIIRDELTALQAGLDQIGVSFTQTGTGARARAISDKLRETALSAGDFTGADASGVSDTTTCLQNLFNAAASQGRYALIPEGLWRVNTPIVLPENAAGLIMLGRIVYHGTGIALTIGGSSTTRVQFKKYVGIHVQRNTQSDWSSEAEIGVLARNLDNCVLEVLRIANFTIGLRTLGSGPNGFEDSNIFLGRLVNNRIGLDVRAANAASWNNANRYFGGHFANDSAVNPTQNRYGVRFSNDPGGYELHNAHAFYAPSFELQRQGDPATVEAVPFLVGTNGRALQAHDIRMEACSRQVAIHEAGFSDAHYNVAFVGTYGNQGSEVAYRSTATRAGGTVTPMHQAIAAQNAMRLLAGDGNVRRRAFKDTRVSSTGIGFDEMCVLSSNPTGPPTTLNGFCFGGLSSIGLQPGHVQLPTSRALAYVVDCSICKDFYLAVDGDNMRPVLMQFDAAENLLQDTVPLYLSNANVNWNPAGTAYWWEMSANLDETTGGEPLNRLQRVTFHPNARFGVIGVRGGDSVTPTNNRLRGFRIYTNNAYAPRVLFGADRLWGERELRTEVTWNVPALTAGAIAQIDVTLAGVRGGDLLRVGHDKDSGFQNGGVVFHASQGGTGSTNQVRVTAQNISGGSITVGNGTLHVSAMKPRL